MKTFATVVLLATLRVASANADYYEVADHGPIQFVTLYQIPGGIAKYVVVTDRATVLVFGHEAPTVFPVGHHLVQVIENGRTSFVAKFRIEPK